MTGTTVQTPRGFAEIQQEIKKGRRKRFYRVFPTQLEERERGEKQRVLVPLPSSWRCRVIFLCVGVK